MQDIYEKLKEGQIEIWDNKKIRKIELPTWVKKVVNADTADERIAILKKYNILDNFIRLGLHSAVIELSAVARQNKTSKQAKNYKPK